MAEMGLGSRIYVAGHAGLVGSALMRTLRRKGHTDLVGRSHRELDLESQRDVFAFFERERPEFVFLAAAKVGGIHANSTYPAEFIYNNLLIQCNIIQAAYRYGVKKLLFLGSSCIYPKLCPQPMKEEHLLSGYLEPTNEPYAVAKIAGIKMCQSYNRQYGTDFISVMPTNLYGPNDNYAALDSHVLPALIRRFHIARLAMEKRLDSLSSHPVKGLDPRRVDLAAEGISPDGSEVTNWGTGEPRREFMFSDDMAEACVHLMNHYDGSDIVNIGTGKDVTIRELTGLVAATVGYQGRISWDPGKPDGTPRKLLDVSRLSGLGWKASVGLEEGLRRTYADFTGAASPD